jgi:hypothetical protein
MFRITLQRTSAALSGAVVEIVALVGIVAIVAILAFTAPRAGGAFPPQEDLKPAPALDFDFFKARVEPIFLKDRPGHSRCYSCHGSGNGPQYLVHLSPGSDSWTDEQSRQIFENVSKLVNRKDPMKSRFLIHPLSPLAGGDIEFVHTGGRQFESMDDLDWQSMAAWARGQTLSTQK